MNDPAHLLLLANSQQSDLLHMSSYVALLSFLSLHPKK
jgi:hypothetical protein